MMLGEGATAVAAAGQAAFFESVTSEIWQFPRLKAAEYFNFAPSASGGRGVDEGYQTSTVGLAAFRAMAHAVPFVGDGVSYVNGEVTAGSGDAALPAAVAGRAFNRYVTGAR